MVGFGNMGRSLAAGIVRAGTVSAASVLAVDPSTSLPESCADLGFRSVTGVAQIGALDTRDVLLLAVKPQNFTDVSEALKPLIDSLPRGDRPLLLSIMAGVTTSQLTTQLGDRLGVVRAMPNTPAQIGQGATAYCLGTGADHDHEAVAKRLLSAAGPLTIRIDEALMDAFTAVAGSGPAYVFYLARSMVAGAVAAGLDPVTAEAVVNQTITGAGSLLCRDDASPHELLTRVTSKGGTTQAALRVLDSHGVDKALEFAILAARDRGRELGRSG